MEFIVENDTFKLNEKCDCAKILIIKNLITKNKKDWNNLLKHLDKKSNRKHTQEQREQITLMLNRYIDEYTKNNYVLVNYIHSKNLTYDKIGRRYAEKSLGLQSLMSCFRDFLLTDTNNNNEPLTTDIDIVSAHPNIAYNISQELNLECNVLKEYIYNKDEFINTYIKSGDYTNKQIKTNILTMLNSQHINKKLKPYDEKLAKLDQEFKLIQDTLYNSKNYEYIKGLEDTNKNNSRGSFLNIVMCNYENKILTALYNCLVANGYTVNSLIFDGLLVMGNYYDNPELLTLCENSIENILPYVKIKLAYKPFGTIILDYINDNTKEEEPDDVENQEEINDKKKQDMDWVNELINIIAKNDIFTDSGSGNYYRHEEGGQYISIEKSGLHAQVIRKIQNIYPNKRFFKSLANLTRIANAYIYTIGTNKIDNAIFDCKNIGIPFDNGIFNTKSGEIHKAKPDDYVSATTGYKLNLYDFNNSDVLKLDNMLMNCFAECDQNYIKYHIGNIILGSTKQFYILYGTTGNNGKTKCFCEFLNLCFHALSASMKQEHITSNTKKQVEGASPETLILKSSFVNIISELNDDTQIDANLIKNFSGGNKLTAREMYNGSIHKFTMKGTMFIDTNKTGNINGYDEPTAKRTVIFHFPYEFINSASYKKPKHRNTDEYKEQVDISTFFSFTHDIHSKAFSLMYHYYKKYSSDEINNQISPSLKITRDKFANAVCLISNFLTENCVQNDNKDCRISCDDIWRAFEYSQKGNLRKTTKKAFFTRLEELGFPKKRIMMYKKGETEHHKPYGFSGININVENSAGNSYTLYYATKELANGNLKANLFHTTANGSDDDDDDDDDNNDDNNDEID